MTLLRLWLRLWGQLLWSYLNPQRGPWARPHNPELHATNARLESVAAQLRAEDAARQAWLETQAAVKGRGDVDVAADS